jgi:Ca2+-binding RTX toxin-like protein
VPSRALFIAVLLLAIAIAEAFAQTRSGTPGGDRLTARGDRPTEIFGMGGNDTVIGGGGADRLWGETGGDRLFGSGGAADRLDGGPGDDEIHAGSSWTGP